MDVLRRAGAIGIDRFIRRDQKAAVAERQRRMRIGVCSGPLGPVEVAHEREPAVVHRQDDDARVEPAGVRAGTAHDRVMAARVAPRGADPGICVRAALLGEAPLVVQHRLLGIREVDRDERCAVDARPATG